MILAVSFVIKLPSFFIDVIEMAELPEPGHVFVMLISFVAKRNERTIAKHGIVLFVRDFAWPEEIHYTN
jgi:hypothetical protein